MIHIEQIEEWAKIMQEAKNLSRNYASVEDGGTCNFDTPVIDLSGWKAKQVDVLRAKAPGFIATKLTGKFWKGCYFMEFDLHGQANRRSAMAEAAYKHMKEKGMPVRMYYQCD
jgi:hypothetical protein